MGLAKQLPRWLRPSSGIRTGFSRFLLTSKVKCTESGMYVLAYSPDKPARGLSYYYPNRRI